jgi:hypothetical protein
MRSRFFAVLLLAGTATAAANCARAQAKAVPALPPLDVPAPPPRDIEEPSGSEQLPPVPLPEEPAHTAPSRTRQAPPPRPESTRPPESPKPEPSKPESPLQLEETAKPPDEAPKPPPTTLQTTPPNAEGEVERSILATIAKANNDLSHIDYRALNAEARNQYDTAKSLSRQAETAVHARNLVFAKSLADKAAALAVQLGGK